MQAFHMHEHIPIALLNLRPDQTLKLLPNLFLQRNLNKMRKPTFPQLGSWPCLDLSLLFGGFSGYGCGGLVGFGVLGLGVEF